MAEPQPELPGAERALLLAIDVLGFLGTAVAPLFALDDLRGQLILVYMLANPLSAKLAARLHRFSGPQRRRYWAFIYRLLVLCGWLAASLASNGVPEALHADAVWLWHWFGRSSEVPEVIAAAAVVRPAPRHRRHRLPGPRRPAGWGLLCRALPSAWCWRRTAEG
eukprot:COSAG04_NODE_4290_length_2181_cov_5.701729_1_plen_165_part_00